MRALTFLLLPALVSLMGCAGIAHTTSPALSLEVPANALPIAGKLVVFKPYDRSHLLSKEALQLVLGPEAHSERYVFDHVPSQPLSVALSGHMRAGLVFIIPPLGPVSLDEGAYALVKQPDDTVLGLAVRGTKLEVYTVGADGALHEEAVAGERFSLEVVAKKQFKVIWHVPSQ